jgi:YD repeat-containing protein
VFVSTLSGSTLGFSTYLGGSKDDQGYAVARDGTGGVYVAGVSESSNFPVTGGAYDTTANGSRDAFVAKISGISAGGLSGTLATRTITYTYDGLERLAKAVESPGTTSEFAYDLAGNRTKVKTNAR